MTLFRRSARVFDWDKCQGERQVPFMRRCIRCDGEMLEDLAVKDSRFWELRISMSGLKGLMPLNQFGEMKVKAAACPECGYVELYLPQLDKIREYKEET